MLGQVEIKQCISEPLQTAYSGIAHILLDKMNSMWHSARHPSAGPSLTASSNNKEQPEGTPAILILGPPGRGSLAFRLCQWLCCEDTLLSQLCLRNDLNNCAWICELVMAMHCGFAAAGILWLITALQLENCCCHSFTCTCDQVFSTFNQPTA